METPLVHLRTSPTSLVTSCGYTVSSPSQWHPDRVTATLDKVTCGRCRSHQTLRRSVSTIKAVTADVAGYLADLWDTKADEYVRNMPNGEMVNGIATALHQCAKELRGLCDLAVTVTLPNGQG